MARFVINGQITGKLVRETYRVYWIQKFISSDFVHRLLPISAYFWRYLRETLIITLSRKVLMIGKCCWFTSAGVFVCLFVCLREKVDFLDFSVLFGQMFLLRQHKYLTNDDNPTNLLLSVNYFCCKIWS